MKSTEKYISSQSDFFLYNASNVAKSGFFYPVCIGHFYYEPGYRQSRSSYDSFLIIYVQKGTLQVQTEKEKLDVSEGSFVILDCYAPHSYGTRENCEILWMHFDGPGARTYYSIIHQRAGTAFQMVNTWSVLNRLQTIYQQFSTGAAIDEIVISKIISDILTLMALQKSSETEHRDAEAMTQKTIAFISAHLSEELSIETMARNVSLSPFHFIRMFKKETGLTPHQYIMNTRISHARYLLKNTKSPIKEVCFSLGFTSESIFSATFKRKQGMSPSAYRLNERTVDEEW